MSIYKEEDCIGKEVCATMNGKDFFEGVLEEVIDFMVPYGVRKKGEDEITYFIEVYLKESDE